MQLVINAPVQLFIIAPYNALLKIELMTTSWRGQWFEIEVGYDLDSEIRRTYRVVSIAFLKVLVKWNFCSLYLLTK